ncbi:hypothetical protein [Jannaschia marina]|uniref:hypothetical protein n=1 Tax=Jannaschia marina TaxID=2741674 RepID=UPI0015CDE160|nr:hypothetical protein [Jannaschia marina]
MAPALPVPLARAAALARRAAWSLGPLRVPPPPPLPRGRPIRVGFVVCEPGKWGLGSLVAALDATPGFEVRMYPALSDAGLRLPRARRAATFRENRAYFGDIAPIGADLYDPATDRMAPPGTIGCDIAFLQQPWGMRDLPRRLAGRLRTAYVHYGMPVIANDWMQFGLRDFHPWLWRHFVPTETHAAAMAARPGPRPPHVVVTGHPKFDAYLAPAPARETGPWPGPPGRRRVIFAPHHGLDAGSLGLGTFAWSGEAMLELARAHPDIDFLLRPHPLMETGLARAGLMDPAGWAAYRRGWAALPNGALSEGGGYMAAFRTSDALVTDSGSFLAEYLPTGCPVIRLEREGAAPLNTFGESLAPGFYRTDTRAGLARFFERVVRRGDDPLAPARAAAAARLTPFARPAAETIVENLLVSRDGSRCD